MKNIEKYCNIKKRKYICFNNLMLDAYNKLNQDHNIHSGNQLPSLIVFLSVLHSAVHYSSFHK